MADELISVIVPIYGVEDYLARCLDSLLGQTYARLEILCVDDGSTDRSGEICEAYARRDARVRVFHKSNGGLSDARNYGIERAQGAYITCVDADDLVDADYVEYLYALLKKYGARMSICQHRVCREGGRIRDADLRGDESLLPCACLERMLYDDVINTSAWAKLYARELFASVRYPVGKLFEDIATTYRLMLQCDAIAVGYEAKYSYMLRKDSIVSGDFCPAKLDLLEMTDAMAEDVLQTCPELREAVLRRRVYARFSTLNQMLDVHPCPRERGEMVRFIRRHGICVLRNPKAPRRDKAAILLLSAGFGVYRACWKFYQMRANAR